MTDELKNTTVTEMYEDGTVEEYAIMPPTSSEENEGNGLVKAGVVAVTGLGAAAIGVAVAKKTKIVDKISEKRTEHQVKKLEKKGYLVTKTVVETEAEEVVEDEKVKNEKK